MTDNAAPAPQTAKCCKCKKEIGAADEFCRYCAARQRREAGFFFTHAGVWTMFFLLGPLNLWFLWLSPVISRKWKVIDTFITLLLTAAVCYAIYAIIMRIAKLYSTYLNMSF
ncbi:MAG: hypothetical protein LBL61_05560 [Elusimicrobiota bacterium]|jgi:hypothetical protein|nr:hypothetical protein [Elusimicrobiota bacterium]